jgi:hypothetical protein
MAKAANNIVLHGVRGKLGGIAIRQMRDGSIRLSAKPDFSNRRFSSAQKDHQNRFKQASAYARQAAKTQPLYAELAARRMGKAYNIALSDWFNPPVVHRIERIENTIRVEASDNVMVTRVQVTILDEQGRTMEQGEGVRGEGDWWKYVPPAEAGIIMAEAWDLAANRTELILTPSQP